MSAPTGITPPPPAPSRSNPATFDALASAFLAWFAVFLNDWANLKAETFFAVMENLTDATLGRVMKTGAFGLGRIGPITEITDIDATNTPSGTWAFSAGTVNNSSLPTDLQGAPGVIIASRRGYTSQRQTAWKNNGITGQWSRVNLSGSGWGDWQQLWDSSNLIIEDSTFAAVLEDETSNSVTQGAKVIRYTRTGNLVTYFFKSISNLDLTGLVGTDLIRIPLPFTTASASSMAVDLQSLVSGTGPYMWVAKKSEGYAYLRDLGVGASMTVNQFSATSDIVGGTLIVAVE